MLSLLFECSLFSFLLTCFSLSQVNPTPLSSCFRSASVSTSPPSSKPSLVRREIVASLDEEVLKLKPPLVELQERVSHWQATSESFFERVIQLTNEKEEISSALRKTLHKLESIKLLLRANQTEHEELVGRNGDLTKQCHALKSEVERLQARYGVLATNAGAVSGEKNNGEKDGEAGANAGGGGGGAKKEHKDKSSAAASKHAAQISQLQLRQQSLLQDNILRLQAHYNHLLKNVVGLNEAMGMNGDGSLSASPSVQNLLLNGPAGQLQAAGGPSDEKQSQPSTDRTSFASGEFQSLDAWTAQQNQLPTSEHGAGKAAAGGSGKQSQSSSTASLHTTNSVAGLHATYTIGAPQRPSQLSPSSNASSRSNLVAYPSALKPVHTMHMVGQPNLLPLSPSQQQQRQQADVQKQQQGLLAEYHRALYQQAIAAGKQKPHRKHAGNQANSAAAARIEKNLFHLPSVPPLQPALQQHQQLSMSPQTARTAPSNVLLTYKTTTTPASGSQTARAR